MTPLSIAYLGPPGTYTEQAALNYADWLQRKHSCDPPILKPEPTIAQTVLALAQGNVSLAVVPVENSLEGGVSLTLDSLWKIEDLKVYQAFILPINHMFITQTTDFSQIVAVYSHPQPLGQCQDWLSATVPQAQLIPTSSTAEALKYVMDQRQVGAIASERAAWLHQLPIQARSIQDHPDNCTKFWVLTRQKDCPLQSPGIATHTSLAFSVDQNIPGALLSPLRVFAQRQINLSRIESRPAKTALGDYVFFVDAEIGEETALFQEALQDLYRSTNVLKVLGSYNLVSFARL
ncbi:prephenate dehydratase [Lyngbya confervoides BDU141951]|uniref:Prephenate dehydratase n=2 Tax=Lyngbya TaxID=28073 RepID=A0ABD4T4R0_9CYAN|nr:prephenate dehydratase [Lyngbya confervoides]MCM1983579.1 prephenate dehydratase [Lyngbya confervoides BDU141951]